MCIIKFSPQVPKSYDLFLVLQFSIKHRVTLMSIGWFCVSVYVIDLVEHRLVLCECVCDWPCWASVGSVWVCMWLTLLSIGWFCVSVYVIDLVEHRLVLCECVCDWPCWASVGSVWVCMWLTLLSIGSMWVCMRLLSELTYLQGRACWPQQADNVLQLLNRFNLSAHKILHQNSLSPDGQLSAISSKQSKSQGMSCTAPVDQQNP